jgi:hypothetical protein
MAEPHLINGKFQRAKDGQSLIVRLQLYGEDADRFEQFCIDNEFELATVALRTLVLGGMADWPKWGVNVAERKRTALEFRNEMGRRWINQLNQMIIDLRAEIETGEQTYAHQT